MLHPGTGSDGTDDEDRDAQLALHSGKGRAKSGSTSSKGSFLTRASLYPAAPSQIPLQSRPPPSPPPSVVQYPAHPPGHALDSAAPAASAHALQHQPPRGNACSSEELSAIVKDVLAVALPMVEGAVHRTLEASGKAMHAMARQDVEAAAKAAAEKCCKSMRLSMAARPAADEAALTKAMQHCMPQLVASIQGSVQASVHAAVEKTMIKADSRWSPRHEGGAHVEDKEQSGWTENAARGQHAPAPPKERPRVVEEEPERVIQDPGDEETLSDIGLPVRSTTSASLRHPGKKCFRGIEIYQATQGWHKRRLRELPSLMWVLPCSSKPVAIDKILYAASMVLVVLNCIFIGIEMQVKLDCALANKPEPNWLLVVDISFAVLFTIELLLRIGLERLAFLCGPNRNWNLFDFILIAGAIGETVLRVVDMSYIRTMRVFRVIRSARIIRTLKFVRQLRYMISSIIHSLISLFWSFIMLLFVLYMFSIAIMDGVISYEPLEKSSRLVELYGSILSSMLSLFMAITGGIDWRECLVPLLEVQATLYGPLFIFYIVFMVMGLMNILTAVFCESAMKVADFDRDLVIQDEIQQTNSTINHLRDLLMEADTTGDGTISREEFEQHLERPEIIAHLNVLNLDVTETRGLFQLVDIDDTGNVEISEMVCNMMRLKGSARRVDIATLMYENKRIFSRLSSLFQHIEDMIERVEDTRPQGSSGGGGGGEPGPAASKPLRKALTRSWTNNLIGQS